MATLCADPSVDIQLRLQLLETLELRSLGWRRHPAMADYYSQRALAAKSQTESSLRASSQRQQMEMSQQASSTMGGGSVQQQQVQQSNDWLHVITQTGVYILVMIKNSHF